jgi:ribosomal-protein-alanine N-acetyltransferase
VAVKGRREPGATRVRRFRPEDVAAVMAIAAESLKAANWSKESYQKLFQESGSLALVLETGGEITGFLVGRLAADQGEVLNVAVSASRRRARQGTALLEAALDEFRITGAKSIYLEVRESNRGAIAFYQKHGFAKTGLRKGYYRKPVEPAMTMEKKLAG